MGMRVKKGKISVLLALLLVYLAVFSLFSDSFNIASAPFIGVSEAVPDNDDTPSLTETPEPVDGIPLKPLKSNPVPDDFVTVRMDASDVSRGSLLLINHEYAYDITYADALVPVADAKTASYGVADEEIVLDPLAIGALNEMMDAFHAETGRDNVMIISGFRDFTRQQEILDDYIKLTGPVEALKWASPPGHSEHHAGLAVDLGILSSGTVRTFTGAGVNSWFRNNAYRFGFILRFTGEKAAITGTAEEPWHFRYVGNPHASFMYANGWCLEEYVEFLMKFSCEEPYTAEFNGDIYEVYYTSGTEIRIPFDCEFDLSGNNIGGFIVTLMRGSR